MKKIILLSIVFIALFLFSTSAHGQSKKTLKKELSFLQDSVSVIKDSLSFYKNAFKEQKKEKERHIENVEYFASERNKWAAKYDSLWLVRLEEKKAGLKVDQENLPSSYSTSIIWEGKDINFDVNQSKFVTMIYGKKEGIIPTDDFSIYRIIDLKTGNLLEEKFRVDSKGGYKMLSGKVKGHQKTIALRGIIPYLQEQGWNMSLWVKTE